MVANTSPIFELVPLVKGVTVVNADGTSLKTIVAATDINASGCRVDMVSVASDDTSTVDLKFFVNDGSADLFIGNVRVAIGAGYTTVARQDAMSVLSPTIGYLFIPDGYALKCAATTAVTSGKTVTVVAFGGNYE